MLPVNFLRQLIGLYGGQMQGAVPPYLERGDGGVRQEPEGHGGRFGPDMFADLPSATWQCSGGPLRHCARPRPPGLSSDGSAEELAKLKAGWLRSGQVDKLGK
jgi:hypothetical protein